MNGSTDQEKIDCPSTEQLKTEYDRVIYNKKFRRVMRSTVYILIVVAAVAVLVATLFMPVLQIYGSSMTPTLDEGDIVISAKYTDFDTGDLVVFYIGNKILVKRYIAGPGQWVNIDEKGNVFVDGKMLDEPYVRQKALGDCNIELPYQVPENRIFCMGDHRTTSVDSRNTAVGCVETDQLVGKIVFRVWPLNKIGPVN